LTDVKEGELGKRTGDAKFTKMVTVGGYIAVTQGHDWRCRHDFHTRSDHRAILYRIPYRYRDIA